MSKKQITQEKIITSFLFCAFDKSAGETSLQDIANYLQIKKASLYNHFSSKEEMYEQTLVYCSDYLNFINFLPDDFQNDQKLFSKEANFILKKFIKRYFQLFESEPLFQIYTFINTEKYFNQKALKISDSEQLKIEKEIIQLLKKLTESKKIKIPSDEELKIFAKILTCYIFQQLDVYIMRKKEIVRQNPISGIGSLFALPTDDAFITKMLKCVDFYIKKYSEQ